MVEEVTMEMVEEVAEGSMGIEGGEEIEVELAGREGYGLRG